MPTVNHVLVRMNLRTRIRKSQPNYLVTVTFRSHHEAFIRRSWYSVLADLDATISCHIKNTVVGVMTLFLEIVRMKLLMIAVPYA